MSSDTGSRRPSLPEARSESSWERVREASRGGGSRSARPQPPVRPGPPTIRAPWADGDGRSLRLVDPWQRHWEPGSEGVSRSIPRKRSGYGSPASWWPGPTSVCCSSPAFLLGARERARSEPEGPIGVTSTESGHRSEGPSPEVPMKGRGPFREACPCGRMRIRSHSWP